MAAPLELADLDPEDDNMTRGTVSAFSQENVGSDFHFVRVVTEGSGQSSAKPESILPALQADRDSEAGSDSTMHIGDGSDSKDSSTNAFRQKVEQYGG